MQYRNHNDVNFALNFENLLSPARLPVDEYVAYTSLQSLSRRSRYLVNEKDNQIGSPSAALTYDKHVAKAVRHLDALLNHFNSRYSLSLPLIEIKCPDIRRKEDLKYISLVS